MTKKTKISQNEQELLCQLKDQLSFLIDSCHNFDTGNEREAKRIAVVLRILFYHTGESKSLFTSLFLCTANNRYDLKRILFYNTANVYDKNNLASTHGLIGLRITTNENGTSACYCCHFSGANYTCSAIYKKWWNKDVVFADKNRNLFTRQELVRLVANQDGGAHVDPEIEEGYYQLTRNNSLGWMVGNNGINRPPEGNPAYFSIRQIAHEVLVTLNNVMPEIFSDLPKYDFQCQNHG